jgi:hypothetical protein
MFAWASTAEALVITSVVVTITTTTGSSTYNAASVGWSFPVTLLTGQDLVLAQNNGGYSFDTSDFIGPNPVTTIAVTANGVTTTFTDTLGVLNVKGLDTSNTSDNEAQNYGLALNGPGYQLFLGYADNVHTSACGVWASSIGLLGSSTCLPSPFTTATFFQGVGAPNPNLAQTQPFHCSSNPQAADCYDSGVIRIVATAVPEPTSMALVLAGAVGLAARKWRRRRVAHV